MFGEWKMPLFGLAAVARRAGTTLAASAFFIALVLSAGQALACSPGMEADTSAAGVYAAKRIALCASAVQPVQVKSHAGSVSPGDHCSGDSHSSAHGCPIGCCFACSAVMDTSMSVLQCPDVPTNYSLAIQRAILSKEISPLFRPPKSLA
jgi:hypothetical protein